MELCPHCSHLILTQVWVHARAAVRAGKTVVTEAIPGHWYTLDVPQTAVFGHAHRCTATQREEPAT